MDKRSIAVKYAWTFLGSLYRWGGDDPSGWDCSGLVQEILASVGLDPKGDQTAQMLYEHFKDNAIDISTFDPYDGCVVFYGSSLDKITHVGFAIGNGLMIEAGGGGSRTKTEQDAINQNAFVRIRPVNNRRDLLIACDPFI